MNNIDILEEYIKELNKNKKIAPSAYDTGFGKYWSDFGVAIEALIAENKELKEELKNTETYKIAIIDKYKYISKDKIKAKIEQLDYNNIGNYERRCKQEVLQELLGKE